MSKHTPGPWEVRPSANEVINSDHGRLPFEIAAGYTLIGAVYENEADARLIAAAPDLLDALLEYKRMYEEVQPAGGWQGVYELGNEAIAKATGGEA